MDTLGPRSVLDNRTGNRSLDRFSRHRQQEEEEDQSEEVVLLPTAQSYRTSFSAIATPDRVKVIRSRSTSPLTSSLRGGKRKSCSRSSLDKRSSPKHVTYDSTVTIRHSDSFDNTLESTTSLLKESPAHHPLDRDLKADTQDFHLEQGVCKKNLCISDVCVKCGGYKEVGHTVLEPSQKNCVDIVSQDSQSNIPSGEMPERYLGRSQPDQLHGHHRRQPMKCEDGQESQEFSAKLQEMTRKIVEDYSSDNDTNKNGIPSPAANQRPGSASHRGGKQNGQTPIGRPPRPRQQTVLSWEYEHDRTVSYRHAITANYSKEIRDLSDACVEEDPEEDRVSLKSARSSTSVTNSNPPMARSTSMPLGPRVAVGEEAKLTPKKKSLGGSISNFFRRMSPGLRRKKRNSDGGSVNSLSSSARGSHDDMADTSYKRNKRGFLSFGSRSRSKDSNEALTMSDQRKGSNYYSVPDSSTRLMQSIEQNSLAEKDVYHKFKSRQTPPRQLEAKGHPVRGQQVASPDCSDGGFSSIPPQDDYSRLSHSVSQGSTPTGLKPSNRQPRGGDRQTQGQRSDPHLTVPSVRSGSCDVQNSDVGVVYSQSAADVGPPLSPVAASLPGDRHRGLSNVPDIVRDVPDSPKHSEVMPRSPQLDSQGYGHTYQVQADEPANFVDTRSSYLPCHLSRSHEQQDLASASLNPVRSSTPALHGSHGNQWATPSLRDPGTRIPSSASASDNSRLSNDISQNLTELPSFDDSKSPSYLKLSCAVSGYGRYSQYSSYKNIEKRSPFSSLSSSRSDLLSPDMPVHRVISPSSRTNGGSLGDLGLISPQPLAQKLAQCVSLGDSGNCDVVRTTEQTTCGTLHSNGADRNGDSDDTYPTGDARRDGEHFLQLTQCEENRLLSHCQNVDPDLHSPHIPEEVRGKIRAAVGKANLLVSQKFNQFRDLCHRHIDPAEDDRVLKWEDLHGFWDMIRIQIIQVDAMFTDIEVLRENGWQEPSVASRGSSANSSPKSGSLSINSTPSGTPGTRRKVTRAKDTPDSSPERTEKMRLAAKAREDARKKMLAEKRAAMKQRQQQKVNQDVQIFTPDVV